MAIPELLRRLLTAPGPSGYEAAAAAVWREAASEFAEVSSDALGSSVARVSGTGGGTVAGTGGGTVIRSAAPSAVTGADGEVIVVSGAILR